MLLCLCFFFNDTATTDIYTLSLHDALPILVAVLELDGGRHRRDLEVGPQHVLRHRQAVGAEPAHALGRGQRLGEHVVRKDRKSTRLNSSHANISYAVFCLKKKR